MRIFGLDNGLVILSLAEYLWQTKTKKKTEAMEKFSIWTLRE